MSLDSDSLFGRDLTLDLPKTLHDEPEAPPTGHVETKMVFFINCNPPKTTSQMKRTNRATGAFFKSKDQKEAENTFLALLLPFQPSAPICGPIRLWVSVEWPWLLKHKKKDRLHGRQWMTSKPDSDNWIKLLQDTLVTMRFIESDQSVCDLRVQKFWGGKPGISIALESLSPAHCSK